MRVRYFQTDYGDADPLAGHGLLDRSANLSGEQIDLAQFLLIEVEDIIHLAFWNNQRVAQNHWHDVKECNKLVILGHDVTRDLLCYDSAEDAWHRNVTPRY